MKAWGLLHLLWKHGPRSRFLVCLDDRIAVAGIAMFMMIFYKAPLVYIFPNVLSSYNDVHRYGLDMRHLSHTTGIDTLPHRPVRFEEVRTIPPNASFVPYPHASVSLLELLLLGVEKTLDFVSLPRLLA